jgi:hypothetical protein
MEPRAEYTLTPPFDLHLSRLLDAHVAAGDELDQAMCCVLAAARLVPDGSFGGALTGLLGAGRYVDGERQRIESEAGFS